MAEPIRGYIVDTNVVSNRGEVERHPALTEWLRLFAPLISISVITAAEMRRGLILLERKVERLSNQRARLREKARLDRKARWLDEVTDRFADRFEPIDLAVAERWAEVSVHFPSLRDGDKAIAATALARGFAVATENLGDFRRTGLRLTNPFDPATWDELPDPIEALARR